MEVIYKFYKKTRSHLYHDKSLIDQAAISHLE